MLLLMRESIRPRLNYHAARERELMHQDKDVPPLLAISENSKEIIRTLFAASLCLRSGRKYF